MNKYLIVLVCFLVFFVVLVPGLFIYDTDIALRTFGIERSGKIGIFVTNLLSDLKLNSSKTKTYREFFRENGGKLKNEPMGQYILALGLSLTNFDRNARWNYKTTPFIANIDSFDQMNSKMEIKVTSPNSMPYLNQKLDVDVVDCEKYNSFLAFAKIKKYIKDVDMNAEYVPGDQLMSFCLNENCTKVGLMCKLLRE